MNSPSIGRTRLPTLLLIAIAGVHSAIEVAHATEIRTYRFVPDGSLPYTVFCGECAAPFVGLRADVEGTFTIELDSQNGVGTIVALNDRLVNVFQRLWSPTGVATLQPIDDPGDIRILTDVSIQPPLSGVLNSGTNMLNLVSDGRQLTPEGRPIGLPYSISMTKDRAKFSLVAGSDDWYIRVENAVAVLQDVQFVPEPSSCALLLLAVIALLSPIRSAYSSNRHTSQIPQL